MHSPCPAKRHTPWRWFLLQFNKTEATEDPTDWAWKFCGLVALIDQCKHLHLEWSFDGANESSVAWGRDCWNCAPSPTRRAHSRRSARTDRVHRVPRAKDALWSVRVRATPAVRLQGSTNDGLGQHLPVVHATAHGLFGPGRRGRPLPQAVPGAATKRRVPPVVSAAFVDGEQTPGGHSIPE